MSLSHQRSYLSIPFPFSLSKINENILGEGEWGERRRKSLLRLLEEAAQKREALASVFVVLSTSPLTSLAFLAIPPGAQ